MQCPKCQAEVPEWHFYCPSCCAQVQTYRPEVETPPRGRFERAGVRVLNALVWISIIAALILTGRAVQWNELFAAVRGYTDVSEKSETDSKVKRGSRIRSDEGHPDSKAPKSQKPRPSAEPVRIESAPVVDPPDSTSKSAGPPTPPTTVDAHPDIERGGAKNGNETGLVSINSHTSARIYINGQFSGVTPRTIKLAAGDHQIRLIADGYEDWLRRVRLKTKQQVEVMASMKKKGVQKD